MEAGKSKVWPLLVIAFAVWALAALTGCETTTNTTREMPAAPKTAAVLRSGDGLLISLSGIPDPSTSEVQVDDQGFVNLSYIGPVKAAGQTPSEFAADVRQTYIQRQIYRTVDVSVSVTDRFVYVGGEVAQPGRVIWTPDLSFLKAIQAAGGFSLYAREGGVQLSRDGKSYVIDADQALEEPEYDPKLFPGDSINVPRSAF